MNLKDSLETLRLCSSMELDFIHVSCWDIQAMGVHQGQEMHYTTVFERAFPSISLSSPPAVCGAPRKQERRWNKVVISSVLGERASAIPTGRDTSTRTSQSHCALRLASSLGNCCLDPTFIDYMRRWDGFVKD